MTSEFDTAQELVGIAKNANARDKRETVDRALELLSNYIDEIHEFAHDLERGLAANNRQLHTAHFLSLRRRAMLFLENMDRFIEQEREA